MVEGAKKVGADRIEFYTEPYASHFHVDKVKAIRPYIEAGKVAHEIGLGINAGHDLDLHNLKFLKDSITYLDEVSIGHALVADALDIELANAVRAYLRILASASVEPGN